MDFRTPRRRSSFRDRLPNMPKKAESKRPRINCQFLEDNWNPVRDVRQVDGEFTCSCGSVLRNGKIFFCDICKCEFGPCCHPDFSERHKYHERDLSAEGSDRFCDYLPPRTCPNEGLVRCACCNLMLCRNHARKADLSRLSLPSDIVGEKLAKVIVCRNCKYRLDPDPDREPQPYHDDRDESEFDDDYDFRKYLRTCSR